MLNLTDDGAKIILKGQSTPKGDGLFWLGSALLIGAVGVAMAMSLLPERLAIGALALLIVGSFIFNWLRQQQKKKTSLSISGGELMVRSGGFTHQGAGSPNRLAISPGDRIEVTGTQLVIFNERNQPKCQISGFESAKEAEIMEAVLNGQQFGKRNAKIRMQSN